MKFFVIPKAPYATARTYKAAHVLHEAADGNAHLAAKTDFLLHVRHRYGLIRINDYNSNSLTRAERPAALLQLTLLETQQQAFQQ